MDSFRADTRERNVDLKHVRDRDFFAGQRQVIDRILARSGSGVLVAELEGIAAGWLCHGIGHDDGIVLHYAFVKKAYERNGVFRALREAAEMPDGTPIVCSHVTTRVLRWMRAGLSYSFDPYQAWLILPTGEPDSTGLYRPHGRATAP